jgi:glycine cleavage system aminomethyltransferase T
LTAWHSTHGARLDEIDSWQVPAVYTDENTEATAARTVLAIADISFTTKVMVRGTGVAELTKALTGDRAAKAGEVAPLTGDKSALACRLHVDQLLILSGPTSKDKLKQLLSTARSDESDDEPSGLTRWLPTKQLLEIDVTSAFAAFWLFGPRTDDLLHQVTHFDVAALTSGRCAETGLAGVPAILVRPPSLTISSMRVLTGWDVAEYLWEELFRAGQTWKIVPLGLDALDLLLSQDQK